MVAWLVVAGYKDDSPEQQLPAVVCERVSAHTVKPKHLHMLYYSMLGVSHENKSISYNYAVF